MSLEVRFEIHQFNTDKKLSKLGFNNILSVNLKPHGQTSSFTVIIPTLMQASTLSISFMISIQAQLSASSFNLLTLELSNLHTSNFNLIFRIKLQTPTSTYSTSDINFKL